jgi:hypothetical protein
VGDSGSLFFLRVQFTVVLVAVDQPPLKPQVVAKVRPAELEQVIKLVGWSPNCHRAPWLTCNGLQQS